MCPDDSQQEEPSIGTAACLIVGDEILGGKIDDANSPYMAKFCFGLGIELKKIEIVTDDEEEIIKAAKRLSNDYDIVVTSGGIGPTHDDVTYPALAEAFGLNLRLNQQAYEGMVRYYKEIDFEIDSPEREATIRMAMLPFDDTRSPESQALFNVQGLWSPVCVVNHNIYTLPGIPDLFQRQLNGLKKHWAPRLSSKQDAPSQRILIETPKTESEIAPYLTELQDRVRYQSIKVGSYERWGKETNTVTLVGRDVVAMEALVLEIENRVNGRRVEYEGEND